jgi:hypothetical protein
MRCFTHYYVAFMLLFRYIYGLYIKSGATVLVFQAPMVAFADGLSLRI